MADLSLGGLATGMDTDSIINQLVQLEQRPIYNYQQEISELEQTKGAWRDINSRLDHLENKLTDLKLSSTYNSRTASSTKTGLSCSNQSLGCGNLIYCNIIISFISTIGGCCCNNIFIATISSSGIIG